MLKVWTVFIQQFTVLIASPPNPPRIETFSASCANFHPAAANNCRGINKIRYSVNGATGPEEMHVNARTFLEASSHGWAEEWLQRKLHLFMALSGSRELSTLRSAVIN